MISSHNLRGLSLIADLHIIVGVVMLVSSSFSFLIGSLYGLIPIGVGVLFIAIGHYLDDLYQLAWWAVIILNICALVATLSSVVFVFNLIYSVTFIINMVLSFLVISYLLKKDVRSLFFEESSSD